MVVWQQLDPVALSQPSAFSKFDLALNMSMAYCRVTYRDKQLSPVTLLEYLQLPVSLSCSSVLATAPLCCACEGTSGSLIEDTFFSPLTRFVKSNSHEGICVEKGQSIKKDYNTKSSGWNQQLSIPAQPQIVQCHLLSKI